jgi:hypothetical protein
VYPRLRGIQGPDHESRWSKAQSRAEEERGRTKSIENPAAACATLVASGGAGPRHAGGFVCRGGGDGARGRGWVIFQDGRALFGGKLPAWVAGTGSASKFDLNEKIEF